VTRTWPSAGAIDVMLGLLVLFIVRAGIRPVAK
jgi:hypothetical protein